MGDRVARVWASVDHRTVAALGQAFAASDFAGRANNGADDRVVLWLQRFGVGDVLVGDDQDVDRHLRIDVAERGHLVVLEHDAGGNLTADDLAKDAVRIWTVGHPVRTIDPRAHTAPAPPATAKRSRYGGCAARAL